MVGPSLERSRQKRVITRLTIIILSVISFIMFLTFKGTDLGTGKIQNSLEDGVAPILTYLSIPLRGGEKLISDMKARQEVFKENETLRAELNRLRDMEMRANALALKVAEFETLLNVNAGQDIATNQIAARAVSERQGPFVRSALLNAGRGQGVEKGYAVMTVKGLYGHIVRVGQSSARVLRLTDLNSRIAVMSLRTDGRAILSGDNTNFPSLSYISNADDWQRGDEVVSSGDDGVLPRGLPIGIVRQLKTGALKVDLYTREEAVDWVSVLPFTPITAPDSEAVRKEDNVGAGTDTRQTDVNEAETPALNTDGQEP